MGRARRSGRGRAGVGGFLRLGHLGTDCYIFGAGEGGREGPAAEAVPVAREERRGPVTRDAGGTIGEELKKNQKGW